LQQLIIVLVFDVLLKVATINYCFGF